MEQNGLPFEYDPRGMDDEVTAFGGMPVLVETMTAMGIQQSVKANVHVRQRQSACSEANLVETVCMMQAAGGDRMEDVERLGLDMALVKLLDKYDDQVDDRRIQSRRQYVRRCSLCNDILVQWSLHCWVTVGNELPVRDVVVLRRDAHRGRCGERERSGSRCGRRWNRDVGLIRG